MKEEEKSFKEIKNSHLIILRNIVLKDQKNFFLKNQKYLCIKDSMYAILLIQGAALHFLNKRNGIKDFDVLVLYKKSSNQNIKVYPKRLKQYDCGMAEFGRYPKDSKKFSNRRVDIFMREISESLNHDMCSVLRNYFKEAKTGSVKEWRKKAAIGIWPENILGKIIWGN